MQRLIVTGPCKTQFEDIPIPKCPNDGILVKTLVTAISTGTEIRVYRWIPVDHEGEMLHGGVPFPKDKTENGYSMIGEVIEIGKDVKNFQLGDHVFLGETHKQYAAAKADQAIKIPSNIPVEHAVMLNILGVGQIALRTGDPSMGEIVAIIGLGVIGLSALAYCKAFGINTIGIDLDKSRQGLAKTMGADLVLSPTDPKFENEINKISNGQGVDIAIEAASNWNAIKTSSDIVRRKGVVVVVARHTDMPKYNPVGHPYFSNALNLRTVYGYDSDGNRWDKKNSTDMTIKLLSENRLQMDAMITHKIKWNEIPEIYDRLDKGDLSIGGVIVDWR
ncbi:MAG: hypothetical protein CL758_09150 [Chloroflexi bacterium]|nr:hypothetical protein [Chloroflexota bacterium]|tara:strand:- start:35 stop:1033 length:999 start_codon:yes stop_codon:yes gene_type:complete